ncbi:MAG: hypothetical protein U0841_12100 [Chloroflexia bacterium]
MLHIDGGDRGVLGGVPGDFERHRAEDYRIDHGVEIDGGEIVSGVDRRQGYFGAQGAILTAASSVPSGTAVKITDRGK